jgi:large subunit ribosomal protein L21
MEAYAVVETGGKQYMVRANDTLRVERLSAEIGESVEIQPVLAVSNGTTLTVGAPAVEGAKVTATVVNHIRGKKVVAFKKKRRKGYSRKIGHRQDLTVLKVQNV